MSRRTKICGSSRGEPLAWCSATSASPTGISGSRSCSGLSVDAGDPWEEAISRNDLACYLHETGDLEGAEREIERALAVAHSVPGLNNFALGVLHSTRADIRLLGERPEAALQDAEAAIGRLLESGDPNPYVFGVTVRAQVQARMALGQFDDARESGEGALAWLGDRVPRCAG